MGERAGREGRGGGVPNSRELRGAYGLHGNTAAGREGGVWEPWAGGFENEGFTKEAPSSQDKGLVRDSSLRTRTALPQAVR